MDGAAPAGARGEATISKTAVEYRSLEPLLVRATSRLQVISCDNQSKKACLCKQEREVGPEDSSTLRTPLHIRYFSLPYVAYWSQQCGVMQREEMRGEGLVLTQTGRAACPAPAASRNPQAWGRGRSCGPAPGPPCAGSPGRTRRCCPPAQGVSRTGQKRGCK